VTEQITCLAFLCKPIVKTDYILSFCIIKLYNISMFERDMQKNQAKSYHGSHMIRPLHPGIKEAPAKRKLGTL
jgi:hypothetical protein